MASPNKVVGFPRAATGYEFLRVCDELQKRFEEVVAPILIVHGGADPICDPNGVKELYKRASSKDKTIHVYDDMLHMLVGESDEIVEMVFGEIVKWLQDRSPSKLLN